MTGRWYFLKLIFRQEYSHTVIILNKSKNTEYVLMYYTVFLVYSIELCLPLKKKKTIYRYIKLRVI